MKNWKTTLFGIIALVLPLLAWQGYITDKQAELMLYLCVASGLAVSADAQKLKDKINENKGKGSLWVIILLPFLTFNCTALRQIEYDQVAKAFSEKAIRHIFEQPNFNFDSDSIYLEKEVNYNIIDKAFLGKAHIFTSEGESSLKTLSIKIQVSWLYLPATNRVRLKFKKIRYGKHNIGAYHRSVGSKYCDRVYCKSLARFKQFERKATRDDKKIRSIGKRAIYA